jgi:hypothetical protein
MIRITSYLCGFLLILFSTETLSATKVRGFPVSLEGTADLASPLAVDVDLDGRLELIVATRSHIYVLEADGSAVPGFPVELGKGKSLSTSLVVGILSGSTTPSIMFGTSDKRLVAIEMSGQARSGFPLQLKASLSGAPSLGDLDGNGDLDILFSTHDEKIHVLNGAGQSLPGFPRNVGSRVKTPITLGRFSPKSELVMLFGDVDGRLHAWNRLGREVDGFPYQARFTLASQPVLGDVNDDGMFEVVFGAMDYKIHVVKSDGTSIAGFPVSTGYRIYSACALADVDGDGVVDVIATSGDGKLYVFSGTGKALPGFPITLGDRLRSSPVAGDVDLDGRVEIAVGSDRNRLYLVRANGVVYPGFPSRLSDRVDVAPLMIDMTGSGSSEIVALAKDGGLHAFRMLKKGKGKPGLVWPSEGRDPQRSGVFRPNPARYVKLAIEPVHAKTTDPLRLTYVFFDLDGEPESNTRIQWYRDNHWVEELDGARQVPATGTRKHQRWHFTVQAGPTGRTFTSPVIEIENTPPLSPKIVLSPSFARTQDELKATVAEDSMDVDGDKIRYQITWLKNRRPQKGRSTSVVLARHTKKGERWTVVLTPNDGEVNGKPARDSLSINNSKPSAAVVFLVPKRIRVRSKVEVKIKTAGSDPDGDAVRYKYKWFVDDRLLNLSESAHVLPAGMFRKHNRLKVEVSSFDGSESGGVTIAKAQVFNEPPSAPKIRISPESPTTRDDLLVEIVQPSVDRDGDSVSYRYAWRRKGKKYVGSFGASRKMPHQETLKEEIWSVEVIPSDGECDGKSSLAEVVIVNSAPGSPRVQVVNPQPPINSDLEIKLIQQAEDPDGDKAWSEVIWSSAGRELLKGKNLWKFPSKYTQKGGRYSARIVPTDGVTTGKETQWQFSVSNSPPSSCKIAILGGQTGKDLRVQELEPTRDPDGDKVEMHYRWYRNGEPFGNAKRPERIDGSLVQNDQNWLVIARGFDGELEGPICQAMVKIANRSPIPPKISLVPQKPTITDSLSMRVLKPGHDPDGDEMNLKIHWVVDGKVYPSSLPVIPKRVLRKGQAWKISVSASDGRLDSEIVTAEVVVANSLPSKPKIHIHPKRPVSIDDLVCRLSAATVDPDGDALEHRYEWFLLEGKRKNMENGAKSVHTGAALSAGKTHKGQRWLCRVSATDGSVWGPSETIETSIGNAAPSAPVVKILPESPRDDQTIRCVVEKKSEDPDGDRLRYSFQWFKDGVAQPFASTTDLVPIRLTRQNDIWQCRVVANDGYLDGPPADSQEIMVRR